MQAKLQVIGNDDSHREYVSLRDWLAREPQFRGGIQAEGRPVEPGSMGALEDVLMVALGSGGTATVLAKSVSVWLQQRRSGLSVKMTAPDGTHIEITSEGAASEQIAEMFGVPRS